MKAIILAAGEGTRLRPLTNTKPKPMINIFAKPLIEHNIENIYNNVDEIIIVVKYKKEAIIDYFGNNYKGTKITYVEQGDEKGTGAAMKGIKVSKTDLLVLNGDSIFDKKDLDKIINLDGYGALVKNVKDPSDYGVYKQDKNGYALEVVEKPKTFIGNLVGIGVYKFNEKIVEISKNIPISKRGEYEITDSINLFLKEEKFNLLQISGEFIDIGYPWHILSANSYFLNKLEKSIINGKIEDGVTINGNIILEDGAIIKTGTYIEGNVYIGKNTIIGPNAHLRGNSVILNDCAIGHAEIKECFIGNKTKAKHFGYIGSSVIGDNVNIAAGFISMDRRHDNTSVKFMIKGNLIDSGSRKLGCVVGDNVRTGVNTLLYPGRIIPNDTFTMPGDIIR